MHSAYTAVSSTEWPHANLNYIIRGLPETGSLVALHRLKP